MILSELIAALADPAAYPQAVDTVDVRQTHISVVFLAGDTVYKIKKPVRLGFVDFSTLQRRLHYCREEVRLNARLAPHVYLDAVPIVAGGGGVRVEAAGEAVEWAVKMRRLPDDATLEHRLEQGTASTELIAAIARRIAAFHESAEASERIASFGRFEVVARNARENFLQTAPHAGVTVSVRVLERLSSRTEQSLVRWHALIDERAGRGIPRDTHGDLRLDHVYLLEDGRPDARLVIIDCIEFNEAFRFADPVADLAFLVMDLKYEGRADLAAALTDAYFDARDDDDGRALLPFYIAYRAAVRGKVEGFRQADANVPAADRADAVRRARGYWLLALGELEPPEARPGLVLVGGLPGSGKSTLAAELARRGGFELIRSDVVRKRLAAVPEAAPRPAAFGAGLYSAAWNDATYAECVRLAEACWFEGGRVIVDASFREEARRRQLLDAAARWKVPGVLLMCAADSQTIRRRLAARRGDASDADWNIYQRAAAAWESCGEPTRPAVRTIDTGGTLEASVAQALQAIGGVGLVG